MHTFLWRHDICFINNLSMSWCSLQLMKILISTIALLMNITINPIIIKNLIVSMATALAFSTLLVTNQANAALLLDTTLKGGDIGGNVEIFAEDQWQEIAIPFSVARDGRIKKIETGLYYGQGMTPMVIGISNVNLIGTSGFPSSIWSTNICGVNRKNTHDCGYYGFTDPWVGLEPGELFVWKGDLFLAAGDYWLYGSIHGDQVFGGWGTNESIPTDNWATKSCLLGYGQGVGCYYDQTNWTPVSEHGPTWPSNITNNMMPGGAFGTPIARIFFQPVPEPVTLALFGLGLVGLALTKRRKN